jgi:hypothetical protein
VKRETCDLACLARRRRGPPTSSHHPQLGLFGVFGLLRDSCSVGAVPVIMWDVCCSLPACTELDFLVLIWGSTTASQVLTTRPLTDAQSKKPFNTEISSQLKPLKSNRDPSKIYPGLPDDERCCPLRRRSMNKSEIPGNRRVRWGRQAGWLK